MDIMFLFLITFEFNEERGTLFVSRYNSLHKLDVKLFPLDHDKARLEIVEVPITTQQKWWNPTIGILELKGRKRNIIISNTSNEEIVFILSGVRDMEVDRREISRIETPEGSYEGFITGKIRIAGVPHFVFKIEERRDR